MNGPAWIFAAAWLLTTLGFVMVNSDRMLWRDRALARWGRLHATSMPQSVDERADEAARVLGLDLDEHDPAVDDWTQSVIDATAVREAEKLTGGEPA